MLTLTISKLGNSIMTINSIIYYSTKAQLNFYRNSYKFIGISSQTKFNTTSKFNQIHHNSTQIHCKFIINHRNSTKCNTNEMEICKKNSEKVLKCAVRLWRRKWWLRQWAQNIKGEREIETTTLLEIRLRRCGTAGVGRGWVVMSEKRERDNHRET